MSAAFSILIVAGALGQRAPELDGPSNVSIDPSQPAPSILYSDILKSMSDQVAWETGKFRVFEQVRMTFLPAATYSARGGNDARLAHEISNAEGQVGWRAFWDCSQDKFPFWICNAVGNSDPPVLLPGEYSFTWFIEGEAFWKLPITVTREGDPNDIFSQPKFYFDGPWDDYAYFYIGSGNTSSTPTFNIFLRDKESRPGGNWVEKTLEVDVRRDGQTVGGYPMVGRSGDFTLKPWWEVLEVALREPDEGGAVFPATNILETGEYEVIVKLGGEPYATYTYEAEDGQIPRTGRQDRNSADPLELLEGGRDRFYIRRVVDEDESEVDEPEN